MRAPRLLAATAALLVLPWAIPGALAHTDSDYHRLTWGNATAPDGKEVFSNDEVVVVEPWFNDGVKSWEIVIRPSFPGLEPRVCHEDFDASQAERDPDIECPWDTTHAGNDNNGVSANGKYTIEVTAVNARKCFALCFGTPPAEVHELRQAGTNPLRWREVYVSNPVLKPSGVSRSFDSGSRTITVRWNANPEPDLQKYVIQEKVGDGDWKDIGERPPGTTSLQRPISEVGVYTYRVAAIRAPGPPYSSPPSRDRLLNDGYMAFSDPAPAIDVAAPPVAGPSGEESPGSPDPGPEPGVFVPEPSTTTTAPGAVETPRGGSNLFTRPSATSVRPSSRSSAPRTTPTTADTGYAETLPYQLPQNDRGPLPDEEEQAGVVEEPRTIERIVEIPRPRDARALLIPLAGGLAMFVFAMQVTFLVRRRPALAHADDDFDDWMGF